MNRNFVDVKRKTLFSLFFMAFLLISISNVDVVATSPATHFYVDPPEVRDIPSGGNFMVTINVTDVPETYGWEIMISWDPDLLELVSDPTEGDFLHRWMPNPFPPPDYVPKYTTTFLSSPSFDEANLVGKMYVGCSLVGGVDWASGDGWLCSLNFAVKAEGSSVLNLVDTYLFDHFFEGIPSPTYYPNEDGFFFNEAFHDVAITSVTASATEAAELVAINVTVTNEGNYTETFDVAVYADVTPYEYAYEDPFDPTSAIINMTVAVGDEITVGTQAVTEPLAIGATITLNFTWNTTGVAGGSYTISAEAILLDDDTRDNLFIDGTINVLAHDIAITNVVPSPTMVTVGKNVTITVTAKNEGHFNETFNVTAYYDNTAIGMQTVTNLPSGNSTTLTFTWDTTDVAKATYTIKAEASVVPDEIDTDDNTLEDGTVKVRGAAGPDILLYAAVGIVIIIAAAIAVYFIWFRKPT